MSILCATDLSTSSEPAVRVAGGLARRFGDDELWLLHAVDLVPTAHHDRPETPFQVDQSLEATLSRLATHAARPVRSMVLYGSAPQALGEFAALRNARMLVVASRGHGDTPLRRVGGMSERLAELAQAPLLVVRDPEPFEQWARGERPLRVLLGVNQGASWQAALSWVRELRAAGPCDVTVGRVYYAAEERRRYGLPPGHPLTGADPEVEELLVRDLRHQIGELAGEGTVAFQPLAGVGRIGDHMLELGRSQRADVIAVGSRHARGLARLKSVATVTLHYAEASVALVPTVDDGLREVKAPRCVLVASDLSEASADALARAYSLLPEDGGKVVLLHVARDPDADLIATRRALAALVPAGRAPYTQTEVVRSTAVAEAICAAAERFAADIICLASSQRLTRALGSIPSAVVSHTERPVLLVQQPSDG